MPTVNDELRDAAVRHQIYLTRYSTSVVEKMLALINRADQDIIRRLRARNIPGARTPRQRARLEELLKGLREMNHAAYANFAGTLRVELRGTTGMEVAASIGRGPKFATAAVITISSRAPSRTLEVEAPVTARFDAWTSDRSTMLRRVPAGSRTALRGSQPEACKSLISRTSAFGSSDLATISRASCNAGP